MKIDLIRISRISAAAVFAVMISSCFSPPAYGGEERLEKASDVLRILLPALGFAGTFIAGDPEGRWQYSGQFLTGLAAVQTMKPLFKKLRPRGGGLTSFPSGHTWATFSGALFINQRYGWLFGIPALGAAALTGYSRVDSEAHSLDDVTAGASIALLSNMYWATPYDEKFRISPFSVKGGWGLGFTVKTSNIPETRAEKIAQEEMMEAAESFQPRMRFQFLFGPLYQIENTVTAPRDSGTQVNFEDFRKIDDPTTTTNILLQFFLADRHQIDIGFIPFESRDTGTNIQPVRFGNKLFPANSKLTSEWWSAELYILYKYLLVDWGPLKMQVGGGLTVQHREVEIRTQVTEGAAGEPAGATTGTKVTDTTVIPLASVAASINITKKLSIFGDVNGFALKSVKTFDLGAGFRYQISPRWDIGASYLYFSRSIDSGALKNKIAYQGPMVFIGHSF